MGLGALLVFTTSPQVDLTTEIDLQTIRPQFQNLVNKCLSGRVTLQFCCRPVSYITGPPPHRSTPFMTLSTTAQLSLQCLSCFDNVT